MLELHKLGCELVAIYGAEPLMEYEKLRDVIHYCERTLNIDTTIITSGAVPDFKGKLLELSQFGARSLSMSYDPSPLDMSTKLKSDKTLETLMGFNELVGTRDVAAIATLNSQNFTELPNMIKKMSKRDIWTFFDFIHTDRGQPGAKCSVVDKKLLLTPDYYSDLKTMLTEVLALKKEGYLCHTSQHFIDTVKMRMAYNNIYGWTCSYQDVSWLTIDCDGSVIPCDDFCGNNMDYDMTDIYTTFDEFVEETKVQVKAHNCQCCWNTHIDAHGIMAGEIKIEDYVHGKRNNI